MGELIVQGTTAELAVNLRIWLLVGQLFFPTALIINRLVNNGATSHVDYGCLHFKHCTVDVDSFTLYAVSWNLQLCKNMLKSVIINMYRENIYTVLDKSAKFRKSTNLNTPEIVLFGKFTKIYTHANIYVPNYTINNATEIWRGLFYKGSIGLTLKPYLPALPFISFL